MNSAVLHSLWLQMAPSMVLACSIYIAFRAGAFSLASVGFAAIGAYFAALTEPHIGWLPAFLLAPVVTLLAGVVVGLVLLRLHGIYLGLATIAFNQIVQTILQNWTSVTHGPTGLFGLPVRLGTWSLALLVVLVAVVCAVVVRGRLGLELRAVGADHELAGTVGLPVVPIQVAAFALSAALAGLAGGMFTDTLRYINPDTFNFQLSLDAFTYVVVGGLATVAGPLVGTALLVGVVQGIPALAANQSYIFGGFVLVSYLVFPRGLADRWLWDQLRRNVLGRLRRDTAGSGGADDGAVRRAAIRVATAASAVPPQERHEGELLRGRSVLKRYGGVVAVDVADVALHGGRVLALIGPNGAGKSTLLKVLSGGVPATAGTVTVGADTTSGESERWFARRGVRRLVQGLGTFADLTPYENATVGGQPAVLRDDDVATAVGELHEAASRLAPIGISALSYGTMRWLDICRTLLGGGEIVALDEPTAGLTEDDRAVFAEIVRKLAAAGRGVVIVEHNQAFINLVADACVVLDFGLVIFEGPVREAFETERVIDVYVGRRRTPAPAIPAGDQ